jgi:hypothetical protein
LKNNIPASVLVEIENDILLVGNNQNANCVHLSQTVYKDVCCGEIARAIDLARKMPVCEIYDLIFEYDLAFTDLISAKAAKN